MPTKISNYDLALLFYLPYLSILSYYLTAFTVYLYQITSLYILSFYFHNWLADQPIIYWLLNNTYINPPKKFFSELQSTPKVLFRRTFTLGTSSTHLKFLLEGCTSSMYYGSRRFYLLLEVRQFAWRTTWSNTICLWGYSYEQCDA